MVAAIRDWRGWVWPVVAGGLVLMLTIAAVLTAPEKTKTSAQKHPPRYIKEAALKAAGEYGDADPVAVEWLVTTHAGVQVVMGVEDDRAGYRRDALILVQGDFAASPGVPPEPLDQQRSLWLALITTTGGAHRELGVIGAYAERPDTSALPAFKRYEW